MDNLNIRFANEQDKDEVYRLWLNVFGSEGNFADYFINNIYIENKALLAFIDDKLVGMLHMLPYSININNTIYNATYIYGVAVDKNYRNNKIASILMEKSFEIDKQNKVDISFLIPAENWLFNYYSRFEYSANMFNYVSHLSSKFIDDNIEYGLKKATLNDAINMEETYSSYKKNKVVRNKLYFEKQIEMFEKLSTSAFILEKNAKMVAYGFPWINDDEIYIQELYAETDEDIFNLLKKLENKYKISKFKVLSTNVGDLNKIGMIKYHNKKIEKNEIYINLMFN